MNRADAFPSPESYQRYMNAQGKSNRDFTRMIKAYWGADVVRIEPKTETWTTERGVVSMTYDAIVSDPWPRGFPPGYSKA